MGEAMQGKHNEQFSLLMSLALDGMLAADEQRQLHQHLAGCAVCRAEWEAMQQASLLFDQPDMIGPPLGFAVRVERRLERQSQKQKRAFGGLAVLTSSLSLAGITVAVVLLVALAVLAWSSLGPEGASAVSQVASGVGLMGKGATLFLKELVARYVIPLLAVVGIGLVVLIGIWAWLFVHRPGRSHRNGYV
ncbi:MAG: zf-HC2 domain-containing protein [Anaerolineae bacterium]|jgi:anti-sigma factor RsiW